MKTQTAKAGMVLTNGETYSNTVYLPDDAANWDELPESEAPKTEATQEELPTMQTLEQRVSEIEQVTEEVITMLNDKNIL